MTNELTDAERERLAEFCGMEVEHTTIQREGRLAEGLFAKRNDGYEYWKPDSLEAPAWQIHAILEAVEEEGLIPKFNEKFQETVVDEPYIEPNGVSVAQEVHFDLYSAHPRTICRAVLQTIDDSE